MRVLFLLTLWCLSWSSSLPEARGADDPGYGVPVGGMPSWRERSLVVLTNACRMDPAGFRDAYVKVPGILTPAVYPRVPPVYWNLGLNRAARAHAEDLGSSADCPLSHRSCDGTAFLARLGAYYPESGTVGENVAAGASEPLQVLVIWLKDDYGSGASPDGDGDSNRFIIMSRPFHEAGGGYARTGGTYRDYWVQDFGGGAPSAGNPLVDGAHTLAPGGKVAFFANYYDPAGGSPRSANLVLDGLSVPLSLLLGAGSQGTYQAMLDRALHCRSYHFLFQGGDGSTWRYPEKGQFLTTGEGDCTGEYTPVQDSRSLQLAGDCNQDRMVDISDSLCLLGHLFLGKPLRLPCGGGSLAEESNQALLDVNGDGGIDLADGIFIINFLFLGGESFHQGPGCREVPGCPDICIIP